MTASLEIFEYADEGYKPLVFFDGWQVALLNWEPCFDLPQAKEIEVHKDTDEVFVLWRGRGALFIKEGEGIRVEDLKPGVIYNVPAGVWHGCLASRDVSWIIVENRDTHLHDTELRSLTELELQQIQRQLPEWVVR